MIEKLKISELLDPVATKNGVTIGKFRRGFTFKYIQTCKKIILYTLILESLQNSLEYKRFTGFSYLFDKLYIAIGKKLNNGIDR